MRVRVEGTYEMSKVIGAPSFEVTDVETVADVVEKARAEVGERFDELTRVAAIAVNGVLMTYKKRLKTRLEDGDVVSFVKAAAGG